MAMLNFTHEERELLREINAVLDIPRNTPEHVVRKLHANTKALVAKLRGLAPVLEARGARPKRLTKAEVRAAFAVAPELPLEEIARFKRLGYSEDVILALRGAQIGKQIRGSWVALQKKARSEDGGQTSDPQQLLRTACTPDQHKFAAQFHRNCASKATSWQRCIEHHRCADLHSSASNGGDGNAARAASKLIFPESEVS
jgi:hypothetical protein